MIAHKQHPPVQVPQSQGAGALRPPMHPHQQAPHLVAPGAASDSHQQHHEQQQHYVATNYNTSEQQYSNNSNSSAEQHLSPHLYHHHADQHQHHNQAGQQTRFVGGAANRHLQPTTNGDHAPRLATNYGQPPGTTATGLPNSQQQQVVTVQHHHHHQQQQQYHSANNSVDQQAQPQVPPHQLPYHHNNHQQQQPAPSVYEQQQQQPHNGGGGGGGGGGNYAPPNATPELMHHNHNQQQHQRTLIGVGGQQLRQQAPMSQRISPYSTPTITPPVVTTITPNQQQQTVRQQPNTTLANRSNNNHMANNNQQYKQITREQHISHLANQQQQQPQHPMNHHHNHHQQQPPPQQLVSPNQALNNNNYPTTNQAAYNHNHGVRQQSATNATPPITAPTFIHETNNNEQQYPTNSPTLLQQQLNRQTSSTGATANATIRLQAGPAATPQAVSTHHHRVPANSYGPATATGGGPKGVSAARGRHLYEGDIVMEQPAPYEQPVIGGVGGRAINPREQQQQMLPGAGTRGTGVLSEGSYYSGSAASGRGGVGPPPLPPLAGQQQPARVMQRVPPNNAHHMMDNHHQPHLLGNPTPPLTPLSNAPIHHHMPAGGIVAARTGLSSLHPTPALAAAASADTHQWPPPQPPSQQHGPLNDQIVQQPAGYTGTHSQAINKQPPSNQHNHHHTHLQHHNESAPNGQPQQQRIMPKNVNHNNNTFQQSSPQYHQANNGHHQQHQHHHAPTSQMPNSHHHHHHQQQQQQLRPSVIQENQVVVVANQTRLTLPLRDNPLLGPFRLEHDAQFTSKVFHIKSQLFETLSKSNSLMYPQTATVIQELQFRAYLVSNGKPGNGHGGGGSSSSHGDSLLASNNQLQPNLQGRACNWPELFQVSVNQNVLHLDRSKGDHKAADIFQFCQLGDNSLDIQVNDCYCTHEFVLEAVDRPTIKAFMNSCFKSRLLPTDSCLQKLKFNFGAPGFLVQQANGGIFNEYITDFVQGIEQTKTKISIRCPISARRMRTPTRGHNCKHLQCFDLENFLFMNRERSQWNCPICSLSIAFNMLELDQHQINIIQAMSEIPNTDEILLDGEGQWQAYYEISQQQQPPPTGIVHQQQLLPQQQTTAKTTGTYHPQPPIVNRSSPIPPSSHHQKPPMRPMSGPNIVTATNRQAPFMDSASPASWEISPSPHHHQHHQHESGGSNPLPSSLGPIRRPASAISHQPVAGSGGRRSANVSPLSKKPYAGQYAQQQQQQAQPGGSAPFFTTTNTTSAEHSSPFSAANDNIDDLSPLAAMERTIIQHEQQMGPPPFDPNCLTSSPSTGVSVLVAPMRGSNNNCSNSAAASNSLISPNPSGPSASSSVIANVPQTGIIQPSPESRVGSATAFSPLPHGVSSPASRHVPASPQQQQQSQRQPPLSSDPPQSPMQQQQQTNTTNSISMPATPSSSMLVHGGPETPATPSNSNIAQQHCGPNSVSAIVSSHSPHISSGSSCMGGGGQQSSGGGVDHQPLSNGSASAGSITSTSTMTPSGQSLGSVGMGGDSRCGTAPLQGNGPLGLDDLMLPVGVAASSATSHTDLLGGGGGGSSSSQYKQSIHGNSPHIDEKNEILIGKLMMDTANDSILRDHRNGELTIALQEAEWKQELELRGKSQHLANFLNEPLMKKQQHQQHHQQDNNKMLSGGLNPSDDEEGNQSHGSSPGHNIDQIEFVNYLDADAADNGAGLPPDDSILDLFER